MEQHLTGANLTADAAQTLVTRYIALWNEADEAQRRALASETFAAGAAYLDPVMAGEGPDGITDMVGAAQQQFAGFSFQQRGLPEITGGCVRFSWTLGPRCGPSVVAGTDFATVHDGKFSNVTGFVDQAPGDPPPAA